MEFTQEVAVLQSALILAEKKCGCLGKLGKAGDAKVTLILTDAVTEITQGLRGNLDAKKQEELRFKITAILLAVYLTDKGKQDGDDFWFSVLQEMPSINTALLFDLIKKCCMHKQLVQILNNVDSKLGLHVVDELVDYIDVDTDDQDGRLLLDLTEYLLLQDNPYLYQPDSLNLQKPLTKSQLDVCTHLSKLSNKSTAVQASFTDFVLVKDGFVQNEAVMKLFELMPEKFKTPGGRQKNLVLLCCVANALSGLTSTKGLVTADTNYLSQPLGDFLKEKSLRNTFSAAEAQALFLQTQDEALTKDLLHSVSSKLKPDLDTVSSLSDLLIKMTLNQEGQVVHLNDLVSAANGKDSESQSSTPSKPSPGSVRKPPGKDGVKGGRIVSWCHCRMVLEQLQEAEGGAGDGAGLCLAVTGRCKEMLAHREAGSLSQLGDKRWDWCRVATSARLHGHKEIFMQCMDEDIPKKSTTKFLEFVELNLQLLGSAAVMKKWLQFASKLVREEKKSMAVTTIRMMTLAAYKKLALSDQAEVILFAHEQLDTKLVFGTGEQLKMKTTTAFNRLVKAQGNLKTSVGAVSELLLQAPRQTLDKMVHEAVYKNGLAKMMAEIIESLPTLGQLKLTAGVNLLGHVIGQAAGWELSRSEEQNLLSFITHLLKMSVSHLVLLDRVQLVETVVLPNLVQPPPTTTPTSSPPPPTRALSILRVAMETTRGVGLWVLEVGPVPLLFCLCQMLDHCCPLYEERGADGEVGGRRVMREQLVAIVTQLTEKLVKVKDRLTDKALTWLYNSLLRLHWTALLYVAPLLTAVNTHKYPMRVPDAIKDLTSLPEGWTTFPYSRIGDPVYLTLEAVRVPGVGALLRPSGEPHLASPDLYTRAVAALALLLPNSLSSEAEDLVSWLVSAGTCGSLQTGHILTHQHDSRPETDITAVLRELSVCRLLHDVLQVLGEGGLQDASPELNLHVAQTHVVLLRKECLQQSPSPALSTCMLLTEVFCRLCQQMALLAPGCTEPLYVLLLDVLQTYGATRTEVTKSIGENKTAQQTLNSQTEAMTGATELCPAEERSMLSKTLSQQ